MAQSRELEIEFFQSITQWIDRQSMIDYLQAFEWDVEFAVTAFLSNPHEKRLSLAPEIHTVHSVINKSSPFSDSQDDDGQEDPSVVSSDLHNSTRPSTDSSMTVLDQSNQTSLIKYVVSHVPQSSPIFPTLHQQTGDATSFFQYINANIIGNDLIISTPGGPRKAIYADYVGSGRGLRTFEDYMLKNVWPSYANTHSENNAFALTTTALREKARSIIKQCVNASKEDMVIFVGSGSTAAINKLVDVLNLRDEEVRRRSVVFISTIEHHSNILPWQNTGVEVVRIPNNARGLLDEDILRIQLMEYCDVEEKHVICSFSAASNVTGILTDVDRISTIVHDSGGWIFWDYAAGAPYIHIDMNPSLRAAKDAVFISPHKFIGGPGTPGLLIAKRKLFTNGIPINAGGGTVVSVTRTYTEYTKDVEAREEAGTPDILGAIKTGLVFELKRAVGDDTIHAREMQLTQKFIERFRGNQALLVLGPTDVPRLPIFAFLIFVPTLDKYLHHHFVCSLLNDLFGIQVRSGCSCAGPYVLDLLDIDEKKALIFTKFITENPLHRIDEDNLEIPHNALMKPGFTRLNLAYFADDAEIDRILDALEFIASDGWRFLPLYKYNYETAVWRSRHIPAEEQHAMAGANQHLIDYSHGGVGQNAARHQTPPAAQHQLSLFQLLPSDSVDAFVQARTISEKMPKHVDEHVFVQPDPPLNVPKKYERFIWFATPMKAAIKLLVEYEKKNQSNVSEVPFRPRYKNA